MASQLALSIREFDETRVWSPCNGTIPRDVNTGGLAGGRACRQHDLLQRTELMSMGRSPATWLVERLRRILVVLPLLMLVSAVDAAADEPGAVVEHLNGALYEAMTSADELGYQGRVAKLDPVLREVFDFGFMTRAAVGRSWSDLDEAERARLTELFANMSVATFAARFDGFSGQSFESLGEREGPRGTVLVETQIVRPGDAPVGLNYLLHDSSDDWRIIDIFLDSKFSELARQRAEFTAVLKDRGYDGLVTSLQGQIERLAEDG